jgi:hypothetical protein
VDPNANLREQRECAKGLNSLRDGVADDGRYTVAELAAIGGYAMRLAELVEALDEWIKSGGFLPEDWQRA